MPVDSLVNRYTSGIYQFVEVLIAGLNFGNECFDRLRICQVQTAFLLINQFQSPAQTRHAGSR